MKMDASFKPELLVSTDETRVALCCLRFDGENVLAANGLAAVMVPVSPDKGDEPATIPAHVWTWARKWSKGLVDMFSLICTPSQWQIGVMQGDLFSDETAFIPRDPQKERASEFPNVAKLIRDARAYRTNVHTLAINAELLARIQKAMGANSVLLTFDFANGGAVESAISVEPLTGNGQGHAAGIIMPMRDPKKD